MKRLLAAGLAGIVLAGMATTAMAAKITYEFSFSGDQLLEYTTANGADGSTAVDNDLYYGARRFNVYNASTGTYSDSFSSFEQSSKADFLAWRSAGDRLVDINLWGYGGKGANWGETYRVDDWNSASASSANWHPYNEAWPWGTPPQNNNGELQGWWASDDTGQYYDYANGIGLNQNGYPVFTFTLTLDLDDPTFDGKSPWYQDKTGKMVFWFGAWAMDWQGDFTGLYEGNLLLEGREVVPEPATLLLFATGLAAIAGIRRKR